MRVISAIVNKSTMKIFACLGATKEKILKKFLGAPKAYGNLAAPSSEISNQFVCPA